MRMTSKTKRTCTDGRHTALDIFRFAVFFKEGLKIGNAQLNVFCTTFIPSSLCLQSLIELLLFQTGVSSIVQNTRVLDMYLRQVYYLFGISRTSSKKSKRMSLVPDNCVVHNATGLNMFRVFSVQILNSLV